MSDLKAFLVVALIFGVFLALVLLVGNRRLLPRHRAWHPLEFSLPFLVIGGLVLLFLWLLG